jgi:hypothetical protein
MLRCAVYLQDLMTRLLCRDDRGRQRLSTA